MSEPRKSDKRVNEVKEIADELGYRGAADSLGITVESVKRYCREWRNRNEDTPQMQFKDEKLLNQLRDRFSDTELRRMARGAMIEPDHSTISHDFDGDVVTIGGMTDTHIGSIYTDPDLIYQAFDVFANEDVDFIAHAGDIHEGMSNRPGHIYECSELGYSAQLDKSREVFAQWTDTPIYTISGNHDRWYIKSNGANIVKELCDSQDNLHFLGHDEGNIDINGVVIKLWHGEDAGSYAYSYRLQKLIEAFSGGTKPNVLLAGHTHKAFPMFERGVHCVSLGAIQKQSKWMRSKRMAAHVGFYVIKFAINSMGVAWFQTRWYPFYL